MPGKSIVNASIVIIAASIFTLRNPDPRHQHRHRPNPNTRSQITDPRLRARPPDNNASKSAASVPMRRLTPKYVCHQRRQMENALTGRQTMALTSSSSVFSQKHCSCCYTERIKRICSFYKQYLLKIKKCYRLVSVV